MEYIICRHHVSDSANLFTDVFVLPSILTIDSQRTLLLTDYLIQLGPKASNNSICFTFPVGKIKNKTFQHPFDGFCNLNNFAEGQKIPAMSLLPHYGARVVSCFVLTLRPSLAWQLTLSGVSKAISFSSFPLLQMYRHTHTRQTHTLSIQHHTGLALFLSRRVCGGRK